jgi:hypothetical protein
MQRGMLASAMTLTSTTAIAHGNWVKLAMDRGTVARVEMVVSM